jgi:hypothetical protein
MKARARRRAAAALVWLLGGALDAAAQAAPAAAELAGLIENAAALDGRTVVFEGEAIGGALVRGGMAWINLGQTGGAIGVWTTAATAASIGVFGSYAARGDRLRVRGVFRRACPEHGGDMDIHAESVEALVPGGPAAHPVAPGRLGWAAALSLSAAASLAFAFAKPRRRNGGPPGKAAHAGRR